MSVCPLNIRFYEKKYAEKLHNSSGKAKSRIAFTDLETSKKYLIAYKTIKKNRDIPPKLGFFERRRFVILNTNHGFVKVNKNSLLKRLNISKKEFAIQQKSKRNINEFVFAQIRKNRLFEQEFGYITPEQRKKLKAGYTIEKNDDGIFAGRIIGGKRNGYGLVKKPTGEFLECTFKNHYAIRQVMRNPDGDTYDYRFNLENKRGVGRIVFANGAVFTGDFDNNGRLVSGQVISKKNSKISIVPQANETLIEFGKEKATYMGEFDDWGCFLNGEWCTKDCRFVGQYKQFKPYEGIWRYRSGEYSFFVGRVNASGEFEEGELAYMIGKIFRGKFKNGKPSEGLITFTDRSTFEGELDEQENFVKGTRTYIKENGFFKSYTGIFEKDKCRKGTYKDSEGLHFEGKFNGREEFQEGTLKYLDGSHFTGTFHDNRPYKGMMAYPLGEHTANEEHKFIEFKGTFENGQVKEPKIVLKDGREFKGIIEENFGLVHGEMTYTDGIKFIGKFQNNLPVCGEMYFPHKYQLISFKGYFEQGKMKSGKFFFPDGKEYVGDPSGTLPLLSPLTDRVF